MDLKTKRFIYSTYIQNISDVYMVQAMIDISKNTNQILNIVKARFNLKDKSEAIERVVLDYGEDILEPELRPEFIEKIKRIEQEKGIRFRNMKELRALIEND